MIELVRPIRDQAAFQTSLEYIAERSLALVKAATDQEIGIDTICFFSKDEVEYEFLLGAIRTHGPDSDLSHGPTTYVDCGLVVIGQSIKLLGVRQPDETRMTYHGYGDYPVENLDIFLAEAADKPYMKVVVSGAGRTLIELRHPEFDVLGYVVDVMGHLDHATK